MMMQHHEPECHVEFFVVVISICTVKVTVRVHMIKVNRVNCQVKQS